MIDFTPQTEWIERRGLLLLLAFFFSEIGAGLYLVSVFFGFWKGCAAGWIVSALLGGGFHLLYLGKPLRAWRALARPGKSELSRGTVIMVLFSIVGAIHIAPSVPYLSSLPWQSDALSLRVVMILLSFLVVVHGFLTMHIISAIPFWNSGILPVLSIASGVWIGTQLTAGVSLAFSAKEILTLLEPLARWSLFSYVLLIIAYLWSASHATPAQQESSRTIMRGQLAVLIYPGVILIGFILPLAITFLFWKNDAVFANLLYLRIASAVIADFILRYVISRAGRYTPLVYSNLMETKNA